MKLGDGRWSEREFNKLRMPRDDVTYDVITCRCCEKDFIPGLMSIWSYRGSRVCGVACVVHLALERGHLEKGRKF